jgi:hypothetical protein
MEAQVFPWNLNEDHNTNFTAIFKIPSGFYLHVSNHNAPDLKEHGTWEHLTTT